MGRRERRHWSCVYVEGLLLDGERKSIEPLAERTGADLQALQQFVGQSPWDVALVQEQLAHKLARRVPSPLAWITDETCCPKAGIESMGVAHQDCGALGKTANCQTAVSLHFSAAKLNCPMSWRLNLPEEWGDDSQRQQKVKIPKKIVDRTKNELALGLIDQVQRWNLPKAPVVADSAYGNDFIFREALRQHELSDVVGVNVTTQVWISDPNAVPVPESKPTGRPRAYPPVEQLPEAKTLMEVALGLPSSAWKRCHGVKAKEAPCARVSLLWQPGAAHGANRPPQRHFERVQEWHLIEWQKDAEATIKYWLGYFGENVRPTIKQTVELAHALRRVELDYREMKDELGLDPLRDITGSGSITTSPWSQWPMHSFAANSSGAKKHHADSVKGPQGTSCRPHPSVRPMPVVPDQISRFLMNT